jgi:hypothetical protein
MSINIQHFETLCQTYNTWAELRAHLESNAGGNLRCIDQSDESFAILRYVKGKSDLSTPELGTGLFRSVVWDKIANRPVCMAPPKARADLPPLNIQLASTEDFIDGFMVNAFFINGNLYLATRTQLGGQNKFYSEKTFGQMFDEAIATTPLKDREHLKKALEQFHGATAKSAFVSFVVQHPDHRIVAKVASPTVFVVHMGTVEESGAISLFERGATWPQIFSRLQVPSWVIKTFHSEQEIQDLLRKTAIQKGWRWQGFVFKDGHGGRWRVRTTTYSMLRELRGSESTPIERFLRLRSIGKVGDYVKHYSEERTTFWDFEQKLRARTQDCLTAYSDVHKKHALQFKDLPEAYRTVVYHLHLEWLNSLRLKGYKVRIQNVIQVVNKLRFFEQERLIHAEPYVEKLVDLPSTTAESTTAAEPNLV